MSHRRLLSLLTIFALAWPGCAAQSREETNVLLQELTFVRAAMKKQREELQQLREQTAALAALVERLRAERTAGATSSASTPAPGPVGIVASVSAGVTRVGPNRYRIERAAMQRHLANPTQLARGARIVPNFKNGRPFGFKLFAIRRHSLYAAIGLQNGDIVVKINGHAITTPDQALAVYTRLRTARKIGMELRRRGLTLVMHYTIVD